MIKKKITKFLISTIAIAFLLCLSGYYYINQQTDYVSWDVNYPIYNSIEELEYDSDFIVIGTPISNQNHAIIDEYGIIEEGYTITDLKVNKVVSKNKSKEIPKKISVVEPYFNYDLSLEQKLVLLAGNQLITREGYKPMIQNGKYLLFLRFIEEEDKYIISGLYQGSYLINEYNEGHHEEHSEEHEHDHYNKLKKLALDKFKKEIEITLP